MIAFKLTTRLKGKGTPTKAFRTCVKYCFCSINEVRLGGTWPAGLSPWPAPPPPPPNMPLPVMIEHVTFVY